MGTGMDELTVDDINLLLDIIQVYHDNRNDVPRFDMVRDITMKLRRIKDGIQKETR